MNKYLCNVCPFAKALVILLLLSSPSLFAQSQDQVHHMAHTVMPFDISKSVHIFTMTESGGIQKVVAKETADSEQIALIQQHLRYEAQKFQRGDYSDPTTLHGANMLGLSTLQARASEIKVIYTELPAGAEIAFTTTDLHLLTAIHRWFGAQLSEHGADARAE